MAEALPSSGGRVGSPPSSQTIAEGFSDRVHDAQQTFRAVLEAMARPGQVVAVPPHLPPNTPLPTTMAAVALALADGDTPIYLGDHLATDAAREYLRFHTSAPIAATARDASFLLLAAADALAGIEGAKIGEDAYPDRSATLLIAVDAFDVGAGPRLRGPGIRDSIRLTPQPLAAEFWSAAARNHARYPLGVDFVFCGPDAVAALPRSTHIGES